MKPYVQDADFTLYLGDALDVLRELPRRSVHACVTSPPYLNARPEYPSPTRKEFRDIFFELALVVAGPALVNVGRLWRDGEERLWWLDLLSAAERSGWRLLDTLVWIKPNANPIRGGVFADSHEYVLVLGKPGCELNTDAIRTPYAPGSEARLARRWIKGRGVKGDDRDDAESRDANPLGARARSFVDVYVGREKGNPHPAPMPLELAEHLVALATWPRQTVIDPFAGSGTTCVAARALGRSSIAIESADVYAQLCANRLSQQSLLAGAAS